MSDKRIHDAVAAAARTAAEQMAWLRPRQIASDGRPQRDDNLFKLTSLLNRVAAAKGSDRRLDYDLFCLFSEMDIGGLWDPHEGNDFTSSPALRRCAAEALHARIREARETAHAR